MFVTVPELVKITGTPRHTIYSWIYRDSFPKGVTVSDIGNRSTVLRVSKSYDHYKKVLEYKRQKKKS